MGWVSLGCRGRGWEGDESLQGGVEGVGHVVCVVLRVEDCLVIQSKSMSMHRTSLVLV